MNSRPIRHVGYEDSVVLLAAAPFRVTVHTRGDRLRLRFGFTPPQRARNARGSPTFAIFRRVRVVEIVEVAVRLVVVLAFFSVLLDLKPRSFPGFREPGREH